ncbi:tRNA lysidine(34) synthetase TilS [Streptobacillus moniliformis]|uniref:tRNA lysidine(34) synthetase TilS n=1 Tax=Streptobacillus moniliformis TaxID=34105 RepID=UPI0039C4720B
MIRTRIDGDRLDNKKFKKFFIDQKIDKLERDNMPIVLYGYSVIFAGDSFTTRKK